MSHADAQDEMERLGWLAWKALGLCLGLQALAGVGLWLIYKMGA